MPPSRPLVHLPMLVCLSLCAGGPALARAGVDGDGVIRLLDRALTRPDDQHFVYDLLTQEPGKALRRLEMDVRVKGDTLRRTDFLSPGDVRGMRALVLARDRMYIYLPAYRKVRRLASHVENQSFMGTTFSQSEFATVTYGGQYRGKLLAETGEHWLVEARAREGKDMPYPRLELEVRKDNHHPSQIRYFNRDGVKVKTETRAGYTCQATPAGQVCNFKETRMVSHVRNGAWSKFVRKQWEVNTGVQDSYFTLRALRRGE